MYWSPTHESRKRKTSSLTGATKLRRRKGLVGEGFVPGEANFGQLGRQVVSHVGSGGWVG